ncbi:hypothetical protein B0J12DRAFT_37033 [Macrophomina phaseolina]|uniref:Short-chain dehydrogenase/reductase SDR n=1 Tax=Macrophomina phaseolina TaxID=35725 RepID=A0ABQ8GW58_9PEZI|nr:hypothetical protein B0J12DRAFT_37033 [Macrophomina phaseolina]
MDASAGPALASSLPGATFVRTDVRHYGEIVSLFKAAKAAYGRVDAAVACAGLLERGGWFEEAGLTEEGVETEPEGGTVEVNLWGGLSFARVACGYLNRGGGGGGGEEGGGGEGRGGDRALLLVSSAAGFRESPGLPVYQTTKTALLGLSRNLSLALFPTAGIRTNVILPAMTETAMVGPAAQLFRSAGLAVNSPEDVAKFMVDMIARKERNGKPLNGLAVYVEGGRGWEIEEGLKRTMGEWLGEEPVRRIEEDRRFVEAGLWGK